MLVYRMDIKTALLNADIGLKVFVGLPKGLDVTVVNINWVSLYGLKQSPLNWYECTFISRLLVLSVLLRPRTYPGMAWMIAWP